MGLEKENLDEWGLFKELEKKGHYLRTVENDKRPISELKEEDVDWVKVGYTAALEGYSFPLEDLNWISKK